jgi:hypothetical protein
LEFHDLYPSLVLLISRLQFLFIILACIFIMLMINYRHVLHFHFVGLISKVTKIIYHYSNCFLFMKLTFIMIQLFFLLLLFLKICQIKYFLNHQCFLCYWKHIFETAGYSHFWLNDHLDLLHNILSKAFLNYFTEVAFSSHFENKGLVFLLIH